MRKSLLSWQINNLYNSSMKKLPSLVDGKINSTYNWKRVRTVGAKNKNTYEGYMLCGAMSHIIYDSLSTPFYKVIYSKGIGKNFEDHVFLRNNNGIIICPTYRQMFRSYCGTGNENYFKILYDENPPFFVGNLDDLINLYEKLNNQHIIDFNEELENKLEFYINAESIS